MKPAEVRDKIVSLNEAIKLGDVIVKTHLEYLDVEKTDARLFEQRVIITHAESEIAKIHSQHHNAILKIGKIEQSQRYDKRQLVKLKNHVKIQKLKDLAEKIREELEDAENDDN